MTDTSTPTPAPQPNAAAALPKLLGSFSLPGFGEVLDLKGFVRLIHRRKLSILGTAGTIVGFSMLLAFMLPPKYYTEAVVMLNSRRTTVTSVEQVVSGLSLDSTVVRSEMQILQSKALIGRVVDKLQLTEDPNYNLRLANDFFSFLYRFRTASSPDEQPRLDRVATIDEVAKSLAVGNDGRSYAIKIGFSARDPNEAARIANAFAEAYLTDQLEAKFEATSRANNWLSERLQDMKADVEAKENAVASYRLKNNLTEVSGITVTSQQLGEINSQLVTARAELSQAQARLRAARNLAASGGSVEAAGDVLASKLIQSLREQESQVRRELAELANRYGDRHPTIINKRAELTDLQTKIREEVQKIVQSLESEVQVSSAKAGSLSGELSRLQKGAGRESQAGVTLRQLEREAEASRALYESFLNRFKQISEQQDLQQADARIIAGAEPPARPHFPDPWIFLFVSIFAGAGAGLLLAYLIEYFDRGFRGALQVEKVTGISAIGLVPSLKGTSDKTPENYVLEKPLSSFTEALRSIRTAIHFSNVDAPAKVVMFTSAVPGEGKTTIAMALARTLALAGNKILLIEGDLRRPRLKKALKAPPQVGDIAELLAGDKKLEECLVADKASGMHFIVSHGGTPSPQDLLGSQQMERFIAAMRSRYDMILIDTPPILAVSDAALVSKMVDTAVFVVRWAETPREVVVGALKTLLGYHVRLAGIALSQVDLEAHARYGYGDQGYYYGRYREYYTN